MMVIDSRGPTVGPFPGPADLRLSLLPRFDLEVEGGHLDVPARSQRVMVLLAVEGARLRRSHVAGTLWPEVSEDRALASLRAALWTMPRHDRPLVLAEGNDLRLTPDLAVDYRAALSLVDGLVRGPLTDLPDPTTERLLWADLLSEWGEDWLVVEQERYRQMRLHALEALCRHMTAAGQTTRAIDAGLRAVAAEPLRESAHRALIAAHVAEGNFGEALRQGAFFERLLRDEIGLEPSAEFRRLTANLGPGGPSGRLAPEHAVDRDYAVPPVAW
jgi:DNA-binding SARP family transcriptional activator